MSVLKLIDVEKHRQDTILFASFRLEVDAGEITAVHASTDLRKNLLDIFMGKDFPSSGEYWVLKNQIKKGKLPYFPNVGIFFLDEGMYERLTVHDHFLFYKRLFDSQVSMDAVYELTQFQNKKQTKLKELSYSEKRRVQMAKLLFQNPALFILEEPDQNTDIETKRIFLSITQRLKEDGKAILILTSNMESAITFAEHVYRLNESGLHLVNTVPNEAEETEKEAQLPEEVDEEQAVIQFNKIPTKVNEKMILFDPPEIDYIESHAGQSNIHIGGESFPCMFTLNELESKLQSFGFFRCHRSYIVNLQKVREVVTWTRNSYSLMLDDTVQSDIPLSKNKMAELKGMLGLK